MDELSDHLTSGRKPLIDGCIEKPFKVAWFRQMIREVQADKELS